MSQRLSVARVHGEYGLTADQQSKLAKLDHGKMQEILLLTKQGIPFDSAFKEVTVPVGEHAKVGKVQVRRVKPLPKPSGKAVPARAQQKISLSNEPPIQGVLERPLELPKPVSRLKKAGRFDVEEAKSAGQKSKPMSWTDFCKAYAEHKKCPFGQALKEAGPLYRKYKEELVGGGVIDNVNEWLWEHIAKPLGRFVASNIGRLTRR